MNAGISHLIESSEDLQRGKLIVGLSSAIPGLVRKSAQLDMISFAPFFMCDNWISLPIATVQELAPKSFGQREAGEISFRLKPGRNHGKILMNIINALANGARDGKKIDGGMVETPVASSVGAAERGICANCPRLGEQCVDCFVDS
jgi:hypothetical protein